MAPNQPSRIRAAKLRIRVDEQTKALIKKAARLEDQEISDFCVTALADAARRTIAEREAPMLSSRDRAVFFNTLVNPPEPTDRLRRAFADHRRRVAR